MNNLQPLLANLKKEISYHWRIQSKNKDKTKAICTAYIDARDVMNVLDGACEDGWQTDVREIAGFIFYGIGIRVDGIVNWRWDTGSRIEDDKSDQMYDQAGKSAASDSFKRAAIHWGIGRFLYDLPTMTLPCDGYNVIDEQGQKVWDLTTHINNKKKGFKTSTSTASFTPPTSTPEPTKSLPELPQESLDKMLSFITDGKVAEVEKAMKKYSLSIGQKTVLTKMINDEKARVIKESAKKK